jgi:hypothetical protein
MLRTVVAALVVVIGGLIIGSGVAAAGDSSDMTCVPADQAHITATMSGGGSTATFTVQNDTPLCDAVEIGLAAYLKDTAAFSTPQTLATSVSGTIASGSTALSITLPQSATAPHCFTQIDAFTGAALPEITDTQDYGSRFLASALGTVPNCVEAQTTPTTPTENQPPVGGVEAEQIVAPRASTSTQARAATPGGAVAAAELARTGPSKNMVPLALVAVALLACGGGLLAASSRRLRRLPS